MSAVYLARAESLGDKLVAVKEMSLSGYSSREREQAIEQFSKEANYLAHLNHPNLVKVSDFFSENGNWYLIMDYVRGQSLQQKFHDRGRPYSWHDVEPWTKQLLDVLQYLHGQRDPIIFRDLKPSNIMISEDGHLSLIDFGIARTLSVDERTNTFLQGVGTSGFSPIEQYGCGDSTDARSDIYSLGATLYYLLTGTIPPSAVERVSEGRKLLGVEKPILKALAIRRRDRYHNIGEFSAALSLLEGQGFECPTEALGQAKNPPRISVELIASKQRKAEASGWRPWLVSGSLALASLVLLTSTASTVAPISSQPIPVSVEAASGPAAEFGNAETPESVAPSSFESITPRLEKEAPRRVRNTSRANRVARGSSSREIASAPAVSRSKTKPRKKPKRTTVKLTITSASSYPKAKPRVNKKLAENKPHSDPETRIAETTETSLEPAVKTVAPVTRDKSEEVPTIQHPAFGGPPAEFGQQPTTGPEAAPSPTTLASNTSINPGVPSPAAQAAPPPSSGQSSGQVSTRGGRGRGGRSGGGPGRPGGGRGGRGGR